MTKTKASRRALFLSMVSIFICFTMLIGTTYAWFTDSVSSATNEIVAGNLDVELKHENADITTPATVGTSTTLFTEIDAWEPGAMVWEKFTVENAGDLALKYEFSLLVDKATVVKDANGNDVSFTSMLKAAVITDTTFVANRDSIKALDPSVWTDLDEVTAKNGSLTAGNSDIYTVVIYWMPTENDNLFNFNNDKVGEAKVDVGVKLYATQLESESDSFGTDYDKDANWPIVSTVGAAGGKKLVAGNVAVTLPDTAEEAEYTVSVSNRKTETNANNETTVSLDIDLLKNGVKVAAEANTFYTVSIDVAKNVVITDVTHNGADVESFSYDPTTGVVTFTTDSFSPFGVTYSENVVKVSSADELIAVLSDIRLRAKEEIPTSKGNNKNYREEVIIVLEDDILVDSGESFMYTDGNGAPFHFYGVKGILDLNGHSIKVTSDALINGKAYSNAVLLFQYSNVSIVGDGSIIAENKSIPVYAWANGTVNVYGGNYVTNASERNESAVYVNNSTMTVNVYGGTYTDSAYAFNAHDTSANAPVIVLHDGITYRDFLKNNTTDVTAADIANGRIVFPENFAIEEYEENGIAMNKVVKSGK